MVFPLLSSSTLLFVFALPVQCQPNQPVRLVRHKQGDIQHIPIQLQIIQREPHTELHLVRINEAMAAYEGNYVDKISSTAYSQMEYSLTRIEARVHGKTTDDTSKTTKK